MLEALISRSYVSLSLGRLSHVSYLSYVSHFFARPTSQLLRHLPARHIFTTQLSLLLKLYLTPPLMHEAPIFYQINLTFVVDFAFLSNQFNKNEDLPVHNKGPTPMTNNLQLTHLQQSKGFRAVRVIRGY